MNQIQQLINQMCPNGVEWKTLGEVCEMQRGTSLTKANSVEGEYPVISGGREPAFYCNQYNRDGETITIAGSGAGAGFVQYWNQKIFVNDAFSIKGKENLFTRYLYYCLRNLQEQIYATKKGGGVPHVHISDVKDFQLPIPPLAIQTRIVEILDHFTNLTANLTAELNLRRKQFEHYREKLLSLDGVEGVEWKKLGEVGTFFNGVTGKSKKDFENGNAKFISYMNVFSNPKLKIDVEDTILINKGEKQNTLQYGDVIFTTSSETSDESGMSSVLTIHTDEKLYLNSFCFGFRFNNLEKISPDFYSYIFRSELLRNQIVKCANGVTRFNISKASFVKVTIPIPPLATQHSIVSILDKFTALIENIEKELALRQKQYEYYREELLRFGG